MDKSKKFIQTRITKQLQSMNYQDRLDAIEELRSLGNPQLASILVNYLTDRNFEVRIRVIQILGDLHDTLTLDSLNSMLKDINWLVRKATVEALDNFGDLALESFLFALEDEEVSIQEQVASILVKFGQSVVPFLLEILNNKNNTYKRIGAMLTLAEITDIRILQPAIYIVRDKNEDSELRSYAAYTLGQFGSDPQIILTLIDLLKNNNENDQVREWAVKGLARSNNENAVDSLLEALTDASENVRSAATRCLSHLKIEQSITLLILALKDSSVLVRRAAIISLGELRAYQAVGVLLELLYQEKDNSTLRRVLETLSLLGDKQVVEPLIELLNKIEDPFVYKTLIETLSVLGDSKIIEPFIQELIAYGPFAKAGSYIIQVLRKFKDITINNLAALVNHPKEAWRINAVSALGEMGSEQAIKPLIAALKDTSNTVRFWAVKSLGEVGNEQTIDVLLEFNKTNPEISDVIIQAIEKIRSSKI